MFIHDHYTEIFCHLLNPLIWQRMTQKCTASSSSGAKICKIMLTLVSVPRVAWGFTSQASKWCHAGFCFLFFPELGSFPYALTFFTISLSPFQPHSLISISANSWLHYHLLAKSHWEVRHSRVCSFNVLALLLMSHLLFVLAWVFCSVWYMYAVIQNPP